MKRVWLIVAAMSTVGAHGARSDPEQTAAEISESLCREVQQIVDRHGQSRALSELVDFRDLLDRLDRTLSDATDAPRGLLADEVHQLAVSDPELLMDPDRCLRTVARMTEGMLMPLATASPDAGPGADARVVPVLFATNRIPAGAEDDARFYIGEWSPDMRYGQARVNIPPDHQRGRIERPFKFLFISLSENPQDHVMVLDLEELSDGAFFSHIGADVLVFIHGFNVTFEDALLRTAQIAYDTNFNGSPLVFSWPSEGGVLDYGKDTTNNALSVPQLTQLFLDIKARTGAQSIHVIAHSMGNQAFTRALAALQTDAAVPILKQVILAAPDIDQTIFETQIAPAITSKAERVTVYASDKDHALIASAQIYGSYPRVGLIADGDIVRASGVDVIDVSRVDAGWLGWVSLNHSAYGDELIDDVFLLLRHGHEPAGRNLVHEGGAEHWTLLR